MKLITAIIKPFKLDDVKDALKARRRRRSDRHRGPRVRPPGRPHRDVPRHGVPDRLRPQGQAGDRRRRRPRRRSRRRHRRRRPHRQDRRRQGLGHHDRGPRADPHRGARPGRRLTSPAIRLRRPIPSGDGSVAVVRWRARRGGRARARRRAATTAAADGAGLRDRVGADRRRVTTAPAPDRRRRRPRRRRTVDRRPAATTSTTSRATPPPTTTLPGVAGLATDASRSSRSGAPSRGGRSRPSSGGRAGGMPVLVIGVIHGDEDDGVAIVERLATAPVPPGVDLWLIESMNPDGQAAQQRWNADRRRPQPQLPRTSGDRSATPGDPQYAGTGPASEPETQAIVAFVSLIRPVLGLWYHQDLYRLSPGEGLDGAAEAALQRADRPADPAHHRRHLHRRGGDVAAQQTGGAVVHRRARPDADARAGRHPRRRRPRHRRAWPPPAELTHRAT